VWWHITNVRASNVRVENGTQLVGDVPTARHAIRGRLLPQGNLAGASSPYFRDLLGQDADDAELGERHAYGAVFGKQTATHDLVRLATWPRSRGGAMLLRNLATQ
jgi:hypothetical protein